MRDFSKVSPSLWRSKRFRGLESVDARLVHLYFLTCEHQNSAGCYRLPDGYAATDLDWELSRYVKGRDACVEERLIHFDAETSELLIDGWFEHNPPMNDKHAKGIEKLINRIESDEMRSLAIEAFTDAKEQREQSSNSHDQSRNRGCSQLANTRFLNGGGAPR